MMEGTPNVSVGIPGSPLADSAAGSPTSGTDLLRAFAAISKALNLAQPLSDTLDLIAEKVAQTMGHKYCAVLLADKETGELRLKGSFGLSDEYVRAINAELVQKIEGEGPEARSITAQAYRTRMPVYAADITVDPRFERWREAALETGYKSIAALPLIFRDEPIGVLNCYDEPRRYTQAQIDVMMVVAEQTASAVGIARLITEQRATIAKLNALNERVVTQYTLLERSERAHEALTALLLENRSLDDITRTVAELLQALVVLCDEHSTVWSQSAPDAGILKRPGRDNDDHLLQLRPFLPELREDGRTKAFEFGSGCDERGNLIVVPVDMGGHGAGYLSALLTEESERDFSLRTLEQASTVYALYMTRQHIVQETENRIKGDLLADLLASRLSDDSEIRERAGYLGVDFSRETYRILVMRSEPLAGYLERRGGNPGRAAQARAKLLTLARGFAADINAGTAGVLGDRVVILVPERGDDEFLVARQQVGAIDEDLDVGEKVIASWRPENSVLVPA